MWTSYEAICELATPSGTSEADDPNYIFGVDPPKLSPRNMESIAAMHDTFKVGKATNTAAKSAGEEASKAQESFTLNRFGTPSTPYSTFDKMTIGINNQTTNSRFTTKGRESDIHNHLNRPATGSTVAPRSRAAASEAGGLPQTNLFNATPAASGTQLFAAASPILETPAVKTPGLGTKPSSSAIGYADSILTKARRVASGLYYEASPESIRLSAQRKNGSNNLFADSRLNDLSAIQTDVTANNATSFHVASTPNATTPFHAGVSTVKGEKRALSPMEMDSRKKFGQEKKDDDADEIEGGDDDAKVAPLQVELNSETEINCVARILKLLSTFGAAYKCLCQVSRCFVCNYGTLAFKMYSYSQFIIHCIGKYRSNDALEIFRELPHAQINTGWVQHQIGKAYFEMSDYQNAERALVKMQQLEPHRMKGLDVLSTTLWHLKKEVELSDLAQKAVDFDKMAPEAWFVVGNCFSFQKEHDTAITFFHRSIQLDPTYTYAHTLCGHEYMSNEDFDKAISCYRDAIRIDARHYNAWYGLGAIYFRQEKFDLAEYHFQRALEINPQSSVLHCHLGMAQHHNGKTFDALETLAGAFLLDSRNPQGWY